MRNITGFIYELDSNRNYRIDFTSADFKVEEIIFKPLINDYQTIQIIQPESTSIMSSIELDLASIKYLAITHDYKGFFLRYPKRKIITDLIIPPNDLNFFYPYSFGSYMYIAKQAKFCNIENDLSTWINNCFPSRFSEIDNLYSGQISDRFDFFDNEDFILTTNHDFNTDFGIVLKSINTVKTIDWIKKQTEKFNIIDFELETFDNCRRTRVIN